jgi:hypothetical protein
VLRKPFRDADACRDFVAKASRLLKGTWFYMPAVRVRGLAFQFSVRPFAGRETLFSNSLPSNLVTA